MIQAICTGKIRDKSGKIVGYELKDASGHICKIQAFDLKDQIVSGNMIVENLSLTRDFRLIDVKADDTGTSKDLADAKSWIRSVSYDLISKYSRGKYNKYGQGTLKALKGLEKCNKIQVTASITDIIRSSWPIYLKIALVEDQNSNKFRASLECEAFKGFNMNGQIILLDKPLNSKKNTETAVKYCDLLLKAYMKQLGK